MSTPEEYPAEEGDDPEEPPVEEGSEPRDEPSDSEGGEGQPDLTPDEMADLQGVAEEIEAETGGFPEGEEGAEEGSGDPVDHPSPEDTTTGDRGWGDMYVSSLTAGLNAVIEEHGTEGAEPIDEEMARDLHLDQAVDEWMAKRERSQMEPEQEVLIGTLILAGTTLLTKTDIATEALAEADL